ncbi:MAG: DUF1549 domain-containing protein [Planctomycetota bacterium]|jgi:hypothetical protein
MGRRTLAGGIPALLILLSAWPSDEAAADQTGLDRAAVKRMAARIDALAAEALQAHGLKPNPLAPEEVVARRTYLAIAGRIPTGAEMRAYAKASSNDKGYQLADSLLDSPAYVSHNFNWWADLLRTRGRLAQRTSGEPYMHWLKQSLAENKPYDKMVRELLTADGAVHERGNGATGYYMRDRNMPEDNMSNTIRVFLGSRVECAQCHNHPFDKWTQKQYFEMVAFTGGIQYQKNVRQDERMRKLGAQAREKWGRNGQRALFRTLQPAFIGIYGNGTGAAQLPKDYQYDNGRPNDLVEATPIFDPPVFVDVHLPDQSQPETRRGGRNRRASMRLPEVDSRSLFADWLTSKRNDRFATVIANRMWKKLFGRGLIEPVDDIKDDTVPSSQKLMDHLRDLMIELDYDVKAFQRVLLYTRTWRRAACIPSEGAGNAADLRGPALRRMTAEQAWDSLLTLVVDDLDKSLQPALSRRAEVVYRQYEQLASASDEEIMERTSRWVLRYTNPEEFRRQQRQQRTKANEVRQKLKREARALYQRYNRARRQKDEAQLAEIAAELRAKGLRVPGEKRGPRAGRGVRDLTRASDLPSPAPDGHLLRELGQSERELIQESHSDPTVPQVLALLNSFLEQKLLTNKQATLMREIGSARGSKSKLDAAFLAVLGRKPTSTERRDWERTLSKGGDQAVQDLVWTLVNTHEFLFIQ